MRTFQKVLASSVALATVLSLTASAAYKDEANIAGELVADVELLGALNVIKDDTQGNFNPEKGPRRGRQNDLRPEDEGQR